MQLTRHLSNKVFIFYSFRFKVPSATLVLLGLFGGFTADPVHHLGVKQHVRSWVFLFSDHSARGTGSGGLPTSPRSSSDWRVRTKHHIKWLLSSSTYSKKTFPLLIKRSFANFSKEIAEKLRKIESYHVSQQVLDRYFMFSQKSPDFTKAEKLEHWFKYQRHSEAFHLWKLFAHFRKLSYLEFIH